MVEGWKDRGKENSHPIQASYTGECLSFVKVQCCVLLRDRSRVSRHSSTSASALC